MRDCPRISIALPARNAAATLRPCLASIARQTLTDWECIIVDDGSTDDTRAIACDAAGRDARFRVVPMPHGGLIVALNEGLRYGGAPLIARMDADDVMHRDRLAAQARALDEDTTLSAVGSHVRVSDTAALIRCERDCTLVVLVSTSYLPGNLEIQNRCHLHPPRTSLPSSVTRWLAKSNGVERSPSFLTRTRARRR